MDSKKHFDNLDGLRTIACISILAMHILVLSPLPSIQNSSFGDMMFLTNGFVQLFFILSAFGLCCGYYERFKTNSISLNNFYSKRYLKLLPFFGCLVILDMVITHSLSSLYEGLANLTLLFGFLPTNITISVIGVGWSLGVIFAFYCLFPFFVYAIWTKKRAWFSLAVAMMINLLCVLYFGQENCNISYWMCYFVCGGLIFLYKDNITKIINKSSWSRIITLAINIIYSVAYIIFAINFPDVLFVNTLFKIVLFTLWISYAISVKSYVLANKFTKFISAISFEIYLSHLVIFRGLEKVHLANIFKNEILSYIFTSILVLICTIIFSIVVKYCISKIITWISNYKDSKKKDDENNLKIESENLNNQ